MLKNKQETKRKVLFSVKSRNYPYINANTFANSIIQTLITLVDIGILVLLIWNLFAYLIPFGSWINVVSGTSMYPTMHDKQIIFTEMDTIERGDIVTAYFPEQVINEKSEKEGAVMVKRVIGVPGDLVVIDESGSVCVNNIPINENYLSDEAVALTYVENGHNSIRLGSDEYFVMGDNREVSYDSRYFGAITVDNLIYQQSTTPTTNFYLKAILVIVIFAFDIFLYALIEFVLMECAEYFLSKCTRPKHSHRNIAGADTLKPRITSNKSDIDDTFCNNSPHNCGD